MRVTCPGRRDPAGFEVASDGPDDESARKGRGSSEARRVRIDAAIDEILRTEQARATELLEKNRELLNALWTLLLEKKVLEGEALTGFSATVTGAPPEGATPTP